MKAYLELTDRLNEDLWARRGNNNGGKIYCWSNLRDKSKNGVFIMYQDKHEDIAEDIDGRKMAKVVKEAYLTLCKRIDLEPNLPKKNDYSFRPAYYEWHLTNGNGRLLLVWEDPSDNFWITEDEDGNELKEARPMTYDEVLTECEGYIECGNMFFEDANEEDEREGYHGVMRKDWERLPDNAAAIMATALFYYYCYEPSDDEKA